MTCSCGLAQMLNKWTQSSGHPAFGPNPCEGDGRGYPIWGVSYGGTLGFPLFSLCSPKAWFLDQQHLCHGELVRKAESQILPQTYWIRICIWCDDSQRHVEVQKPCSKDVVSIRGVTFWLSSQIEVLNLGSTFEYPIGALVCGTSSPPSPPTDVFTNLEALELHYLGVLIKILLQRHRW